MKSKLSFLRYIFSIIIVGIFTGCMGVDLPIAEERSSILNGKQTLVLLRITCELEDGTPVEPFQATLLSADNINIGFGGLLVGGKAKRVQLQRFLSSETRKQGWIYFIIEPGIHYIVFQGPQGRSHNWDKELRNARRYRVNLPKNMPLVYIGTLHLYCSSRWYIFGGKLCDYFDERRMVVRNEENLAKKLTTEYLSDFGSLQTLLMQHPF